MPGLRLPEPDPVMTVPPARGPGDGIAVGVVMSVSPPLGPGETPAGVAVAPMRMVPAPLGPGDSEGPVSAYETRAYQAFGPGDIAVPRPALKRAVARKG